MTTIKSEGREARTASGGSGLTPRFRALLTAATCLTAVTPALAQTAAPTPAPAAVAPAAAPAAADAPLPGYWINGIHFSAQFEGGIIGNASNAKLNNGQLFTDRNGQPLLNQILVGMEKKLDPKATGYDWGFKLSAMYGSDARYIHAFGLTEQALSVKHRNQIDLVEASYSLHIPGLGEGGLDVKAGMFVTPLGYELIDPATNAFYSHSYIFNYGLPFKHTGFILTEHVSGLLDLYLGLDTGTNTTFGPSGENNSALGGIVGFGLNMMDGNLTFIALSHIGPEQPARALAPAGFNASKYLRYYNDANITWKANDKLTIAGELNFASDEFGNTTTPGGKPRPTSANAFGIAGYAGYAISDTITLNGRAEVFRDDNGFFVAAFPGNYDNVNAQKAAFPNSTIPSKAATYGALTIGLTYKPTVPAPITGLIVRPEIRYDQSLGGVKVFNTDPKKSTPGSPVFKDSGALTFGADVVLTF